MDQMDGIALGDLEIIEAPVPQPISPLGRAAQEYIRRVEARAAAAAARRVARRGGMAATRRALRRIERYLEIGEGTSAMRILRPESRGGSMTPLAQNGSRRRVRLCSWCGASHSEGGDWPETRHMGEWRERHEECGEEAMARVDRMIRRLAEPRAHVHGV